MKVKLTKYSDDTETIFDVKDKHELRKEVKKYYGIKKFNTYETDDNIVFVMDGVYTVGKMQVIEPAIVQ